MYDVDRDFDKNVGVYGGLEREWLLCVCVIYEILWIIKLLKDLLLWMIVCEI